MTWRIAGAVIGAGLMGGGAWLLRRRNAGRTLLPARLEPTEEVSGALPVLHYGSIVERTASRPLVELLRIKLGMPREVFDSAVRPVIEAYAQYVQLLPAVPARQAMPPFLFVSSLTTVLRALDYRRGQILPRGAPPEVIGAQMHRWTYAVFIAALLCEIDEAVNGLAVTMWCRDGGAVRWMPTSGDMHASGALRYRVEGLKDAATATQSPGNLALLVLDRIVPPSVIAWLTAEPESMAALRGFLAGDDAGGSGAIASIVKRAGPGNWRASNPTDFQPAGGSPSPAATTDTRAELKNVEQGGGDAIAQSAGTRPSGVRAAEPGDSPDLRVGGVMSATAIPKAPQASASPVSDSECLDDFEGHDRSQLLLRSDGANPGDAEVSGSLGAGRPRFPVEVRSRGLSPEVCRFMAWLQAGLADGGLPFNEQGAFVHFVPEGMLLVSPLVFREYATRCGEAAPRGAVAPSDAKADVAKAIQLEVLRAGLHVRGRKGTSVVSYQVMRGEACVSRVSGVVIRNPERFVIPVPAVNPLLIRLPPDAPEG
jgi:hypothetical protein